MHEIVYLPTAKKDLKGIIDYIANELKSKQAAFDFIDELDRSVKILEEFPYAHKTYRTIKPLENEYRMFPVKNYLVFYIVDQRQKRVEIHRIIYSGRNYHNPEKV